MLTRCAPWLHHTARRAYTTHTHGAGASGGSSKYSSTTLYAGVGSALLLAAGAYFTFGAGAGAGESVGSLISISPKDAKVLEDKVKKVVGMEGTGGIESSSSSSPSQGALSPKEWRKFKLLEKRDYNHDSAIFVFDLPNDQSSGLKVASALLTRSAELEGEKAVLDGKGKVVIRPYTPVTEPGMKGKLELLIKRYPNGLMTNHIHNLKPGDELAIKGPIQKFPWVANQFETIAMIAGGSGITPHWQIIQQIVADPNDKTKVILIYGNQTEQDILLRKQFEDLQQKYPAQFSVKFALDRPPIGWTGLSGFLNADKLRHELPSKDLGEKVKIFVCGPPAQVTAVAGPKPGMDQGEFGGALKELGYSQSQVFKF